VSLSHCCFILDVSVTVAVTVVVGGCSSCCRLLLLPAVIVGHISSALLMAGLAPGKRGTAQTQLHTTCQRQHSQIAGHAMFRDRHASVGLPGLFFEFPRLCKLFVVCRLSFCVCVCVPDASHARTCSVNFRTTVAPRSRASSITGLLLRLTLKSRSSFWATIFISSSCWVRWGLACQRTQMSSRRKAVLVFHLFFCGFRLLASKDC
jgi:hypothetical protein